MKRAVKLSKLEIYQQSNEILRLANKAATEAVQKNKRKGIPTPFSINGKIFYEMPDGKIVEKKD